MEVRIGLTQTPREVELELGDDADPDAIKASVASALAAGDQLVWLTDRKGRQVGVVASKIAYIDLGVASDKGRIGFG